MGHIYCTEWRLWEWMTFDSGSALALSSSERASDAGFLICELSVTNEAADGVGDAGSACCILA